MTAPIPKRVLYVTHRASTSPEEEWCAWLSSQGAQVLLLGHPFPYKHPNPSHAVRFKDGRPDGRILLFPPLPRLPSLFFYVRDVLINLFLTPFLLLFRPADLCISADPLNTASLMPWRRLGLLRRIVHYTIDYTPRRFENRLLNSVYHFLDRVSCYGSDAVWNLSPRMMEARAANGVDPKRCAPAVTVPMGADMGRIAVPEIPRLPRRLVYMGHLRENQGLDLCADVFARLKKEFQDLTWDIVGEGPLRPLIETKIRELGSEDGVVWHGYQADHRDVERILCRGGIGLALYEPSADTFTTWADPGKPKVYMACGLPVLITSVPAVAQEIAHARAGRIVPYEVAAVMETLRECFRDEKGLLDMRQAALELAKNYDWPRIFTKTLADTSSAWRDDRNDAPGGL